MINIPSPFSDITGGDEISQSYEKWDGLVGEVFCVIETESQENRAYLNKQGYLLIRDRPVTVESVNERASDDQLTELVFCEFTIACMLDTRTQGNYHRISYFCLTEEEIKKLVRGSRELINTSPQ